MKIFSLFQLLLFFCSANIYSSDKWIVVTSIQYPTPQLQFLAQIDGWKLVVVGDKKTPKDWFLENCTYLSPETQLELGYEIAHLLPWNHYCRKNIGYLYAIEQGAKIIYETDDDNIPTNGLIFSPMESTLHSLAVKDTCLNIYDYFGHSDVWPRGFPLQKIANKDFIEILTPTPCKIGIEQGVVNNSPDVDAIFRLTQDRSILFHEKPTCFLPENLFCPFNSQNTYFHEPAFFTLYIPSTVSMRVADIWRGYIAQKLIWDSGYKLAFSGPNAVQDRNEHVAFHDFLLEEDLYLKSNRLVNFLLTWNGNSDTYENMHTLYVALINEGYYQNKELTLVKAWLNDLKRVKND